MTEISSAKMRALAQRLREGRYSGSISDCSQQLLSAADQLDAKNARIKALEKALETIAACRGSDARAEMGFMLGVAQQALAATDEKAGV